MRRILLCSTLLAGATACPADPDATTGEPGTSSSDPSTSLTSTDPTTSTGAPDPTGTTGDDDSTGAPTTGEGSTGDPGSTGGEGSTGALPGVCGDGELDDDEKCDDGNDDPDDGCDACVVAPRIDWTVHLKNDVGGYDIASDVVVAPDGTIFVAGSEADANGGAALILALAPDGSQLWKYLHPNQFGGGHYDAIALGSDGSLYAGGLIKLSDGPTLTAILHKFTPDGVLEWTFETKAPGDKTAYTRAIALADDAVYTATTENGAPTQLVVRRHALATGEPQWQWNGPDPAAKTIARGLAVSGDRLIAVGAWVLPNESTLPIAVALDTDGVKLTHFSLDVDGEFYDVAALGDEVVIAGYGDVKPESSFLWRGDLDLDHMWLDTSGANRKYRGVAIDPTRGIAVTGTISLPENGLDIHVGLVDHEGHELWTDRIGDDDTLQVDHGEDVAFGPGSLVAVGGLIGEDGSVDLWVRKYLVE